MTVTTTALTCFQQEWGFDDGEHIRVFVRYISGGESPFGFGITRDRPFEPQLKTNAGRLVFFMESKDVWFLDGRSLTIDCRGEDIVFQLV